MISDALRRLGIIIRITFEIVHISDHGIIMLGKRLGVTVLHIYLIRNNYAGFHPADPSRIVVIKSIRRTASDRIVIEIASVDILVITHRVEPAGVELVHPRAEICRRTCKHLGIASPALPLVSLRTVCRDCLEIAALSPLYVLEETVDIWIGALVKAC